jgi:serine/threonine protein kinase
MTVQNIGRYRILRELGRGTLATVYLARDPSSGQQVAVKVLAENVTAAEDFETRFQAEMQALKALDHPAIVRLLDFGREGSQYFLVGRYLPGGTLADRLEGRPLLLAEVVPILKRLADALDAAHSAGIVHGDLSPNNVLFDLHERSFLADMGLSHLIAATVGPELSGAPEYMSPEQAQGGAIDGRADVYSLGAMLYEMLTGRQPFSADSAFQLLRQHVEQPVPQLSDDILARLVLPAEFNQVLARAMAKDPNARYPTAGVLAEAVRSRFVMPADPGATVPVAPRAITLGAPPTSLPPSPPAGAPPPPPPEAAGPAIVGELVREPEAPTARALAVPILWGVGIIAVLLVLIAIWRLPAIAGLLRNRTATPTGTLFQLDTLTPGPSATLQPTTAASSTRPPVATATTGASAAPVASATRTPTTAPSSTRAPSSTPAPSATVTASSTSTNTRAPTFTPTPSLTPTATDVPPTGTATATLTSQPPGPTDTSAPSATVTLTIEFTATASSTPTITQTPTITPTPTNSPAALPN